MGDLLPLKSVRGVLMLFRKAARAANPVQTTGFSGVKK